MTQKRLWTPTEESISFTLWDMGSEIWELREPSEIALHYRILNRSFQGQALVEEVEELPETPVPLEAFRREVRGWAVKLLEETSSTPLVEKVKKPKKSSVQQKQQQLPHESQGARQQLRQQQQSLEEESLATESTQSSVPPLQPSKQLWSSLSQWIPPNALYQPSLHHQAQQELTGKHIHISLLPKVSYQGNSHSKTPRDSKQVRQSYPRSYRN